MEELIIAIEDCKKSRLSKLLFVDYKFRKKGLKTIDKWIEHINDEYEIEICNDTKWLAYCYFDKILEISIVNENRHFFDNIDSYVFGCTTIAIKMEEKEDLKYEDVIIDNQDVLGTTDLVNIELNILKMIDYRSHILTPYFFLEHYCKLIYNEQNNDKNNEQNNEQNNDKNNENIKYKYEKIMKKLYFKLKSSYYTYELGLSVVNYFEKSEIITNELIKQHQIDSYKQTILKEKIKEIINEDIKKK